MWLTKSRMCVGISKVRVHVYPLRSFGVGLSDFKGIRELKSWGPYLLWNAWILHLVVWCLECSVRLSSRFKLQGWGFMVGDLGFKVRWLGWRIWRSTEAVCPRFGLFSLVWASPLRINCLPVSFWRYNSSTGRLKDPFAIRKNLRKSVWNHKPQIRSYEVYAFGSKDNKSNFAHHSLFFPETPCLHPNLVILLTVS